MPDPPAGIALRDATADDAAAIADVHAASIREFGADGYDDRQVRAWLANVHPERYPLEESGFCAIVAERDADTDGDNADVVGFGLLDREPADCDGATGRITAVYVHPDHVRGGVGSAILAALETAARDAGLETLVLTASVNAIAFYERAGYEGCETVSLEFDGVALACLRMRKRLEGDQE